jgi:hypothetical protein
VIGPVDGEAAGAEVPDVRAPGAGGAVRTVESELTSRLVGDESEAAAELPAGPAGLVGAAGGKESRGLVSEFSASVAVPSFDWVATCG